MNLKRLIITPLIFLLSTYIVEVHAESTSSSTQKISNDTLQSPKIISWIDSQGYTCAKGTEDGASECINFKSIKTKMVHGKNYKWVWTKLNSKDPDESFITYIKISCTDDSAGIVQWIIYDSQGNPINSGKNEDVSMDAIPPGTVMAENKFFVCYQQVTPLKNQNKNK